MRLCISLIFAASLLADVGGLVSMPTLTTGANLLTAASSGFETGHGWNPGGAWSITTDQARTGSQSLKVVPTGATSTTINFTANARSLRVRFWVKTNGNPGAISAYVYLFDLSHGTTAFACGSASGNGISLNGGLADWTQYDLCAVHIGSNHYRDTLRLQIHMSGGSGGVPVYFDDVEVVPDAQPLVIFPTYPNYRGMLWPDQGGTVKWNAVVEPPGDITDYRMRTQIVRASDDAVLYTVTSDTLETVSASGPWAGYSVNPQEYDASELEDGVYFLRGTLRLKSDNSEIYAYPDYKIVKEAPAVQRDGWEVWVDRYNRVVLDGKPSFIWGAYFSINESAANVYSTFPSGARDCCQASTTADHYRALAVGCAKAPFPVADITPENPAVVTVYGHGLSTGHYITLAGGTGDWAAANGCHYWNCGPGQITVIDENTFSLVLNASSFADFAGQQMTMARGRCYESDQAITPWNRSFGVNGSNLIRILGDFGMNTVIRYGNYASASGGVNTSACDQYLASSDQISPWLEALQDVGAWHLQIVNHYAPSGAPLSWWDACLSGTDEEKQRQAIALNFGTKPVANTAGFMGLYVADEPVTFGKDQWGAEQNFARTWNLFRAYREMNAGGIGFWASTNSAQAYTLWNNLLDAHGIDPYPVGAGATPDDVSYSMASGKKHGRSYQWARAVAAAVFDSRPSWAVPQLWRQGGAWPEPADYKIQIVSALAAGNTGILWWQLGGPSTVAGLALQSEKEYLEFQTASKVVTQLRPILDEPIRDLSDRQDGQAALGRDIAFISHPAIKCSSRKKDSRILLACANTTNADVEATITMTAAIPGVVVRAWDGSTVEPSDAAFTETFQALQDDVTPENSVHLYLIETALAGSRVRGN